MSEETVRYFGYEASAAVIRQVMLNVVPGLLQTEDYARALMEAQQLDQATTDKLIKSRLDRQQALDRTTPPTLSVIIDEAALRRQVGGPTVMKGQIEHLRSMAGRPHVSIRVLPFSLGAHAALTGPFVHLAFPVEDDPDVVFIESPLGNTLFREDRARTAPYLDRFRQLDGDAVALEDVKVLVES